MATCMNRVVCFTTVLGVTICSKGYIWKRVVGVRGCSVQKDSGMLQEVLWSAGRLGDHQDSDESFQGQFKADSCGKSVTACIRLSHPRRSGMSAVQLESNDRKAVRGEIERERGIRGIRCQEGIVVNVSVQLVVEVENVKDDRVVAKWRPVPVS